MSEEKENEKEEKEEGLKRPEIPKETAKLFYDVYTHDWENENYEELYAILENEHCDKGTALLMFWYAKAEFFNQFGSEEEVLDMYLENYRLVRYIEKEFKADKWSKELIKFDPNKSDVLDLYRDFEEIFIYEIDDIMYEMTKGEVNAYEVLHDLYKES